MSYYHELNFHYNKKAKSFYTKYYLTNAERRDLGLQAGDAGVLLYEYLLRMVSIGKEVITDDSIAAYFGWDTSKAKRYRLKLTNIGWYASRKYSFTDGRKGISYYIGPDVVIEHLGKVYD
jgi:hypothetical protein